MAHIDHPTPVLSLLPFEISNEEVFARLARYWTPYDRQLLHQAFWDRITITNDNAVLLERFWHEVGEPPVPINYTRYAHSPRCQRWMILTGLTGARGSTNRLPDNLVDAIGESFYHWEEFMDDYDWDLLLLWRTVCQRLTPRQRVMLAAGLRRAIGEFTDRWDLGTANSLVALALEMVERS